MMKQTTWLLFFYLFTVTHTQASDLPAGIIEPTPFKAPTLTVSDIDGEPLNKSEYQGKWFFVHFWASWCGPCRREVPAIQKMWDIMQHENMALAFINTAEDEDTIFSFLSVHGPKLRALMDKDGLITEQWKPRGLPATYLVDPDGIVRYQALGGREWHTPNYLNFLRNLTKNK
jgi:thiol-disulfide isomerase/thioredoxin